MKKLIYTASLLTLFAAAGNAQSVTKEQAPKKEGQAPAPTRTVQEQKGEKASLSDPPKSGTRMAITEKGVPASKGNASSKEKKEDKATSPGQPIAAPEKH